MYQAACSRESGQLIGAALSEQKLLETYSEDLPELIHNEDYRPMNTKTHGVSEKILRCFHPVVLEDFKPLRVSADGNCLYRASSLALCGTEKYYEHLRLLTAIEIILHRNHYDNNHRKYVDHIKDDRVLPQDYQEIVKSVCLDGSYQELF